MQVSSDRTASAVNVAAASSPFLTPETRNRWAASLTDPAAHDLPTVDHQVGAYGHMVASALDVFTRYDALTRRVVAALEAAQARLTEPDPQIESAIFECERALAGFFPTGAS